MRARVIRARLGERRQRAARLVGKLLRYGDLDRHQEIPASAVALRQSLAADPENARALYGLASIALDEDDPVTARQYATRCRTSVFRSDDEILKQGLLDLLAKNWPELAEK